MQRRTDSEVTDKRMVPNTKLKKGEIMNTKIAKKFMTAMFVLSIFTIVSIAMTTQSFASPYNIWVAKDGGLVQLTDAEIEYTDGGKISYDSVKNTLTLNNVTLEPVDASSHITSNSSAAIVIKVDGVKINLVGNNEIKQTGAKKGISLGISAQYKNLTFMNGSLKIIFEGDNYVTNFGIDSNNLTVSNSSLTVITGKSFNCTAIQCSDLTVDNHSSITATAGETYTGEAVAIDCSGDLNMNNNSTITASAGNSESNSYAIRCSLLTMDNRSTITASAGNAKANSYAIRCRGLTSKKGSIVTASAGDSENKSNAIICNHITLNNSVINAKTGKATVDPTVIYAGLGNIEVDNNSSLIVESTDTTTFHGLKIESGNLIVTNNSVVSAKAAGTTYTKDSTAIFISGGLTLGVDNKDDSKIYAKTGGSKNNYAIIANYDSTVEGGTIQAIATSSENESIALKVSGELTFRYGNISLESTGNKDKSYGLFVDGNDIIIFSDNIDIKGDKQAIIINGTGTVYNFTSRYYVKKDLNDGNGLVDLNGAELNDPSIKRIRVTPTAPPTPPSSGGGGGGSSYSSVRPDSVTAQPTTTTAGVQEIKLSIGSNVLTITKNGATRTIAMDIAPFIENGRTMVPLRYVGEVLGLEVKWNAAEKIVTLLDDKNEIIVPINSLTMKVNGKEVQSDVLPVLTQGRTILSISNVAKALGLEAGKDILWDDATKTVTIIKTK